MKKKSGKMKKNLKLQTVPRLAARNPSRSRRDFMKNGILKISKKNHKVKKNWKKYISDKR